MYAQALCACRANRQKRSPREQHYKKVVREVCYPVKPVCCCTPKKTIKNTYCQTEAHYQTSPLPSPDRKRKPALKFKGVIDQQFRPKPKRIEPKPQPYNPHPYNPPPKQINWILKRKVIDEIIQPSKPRPASIKPASSKLLSIRRNTMEEQVRPLRSNKIKAVELTKKRLFEIQIQPVRANPAKPQKKVFSLSKNKVQQVVQPQRPAMREVKIASSDIAILQPVICCIPQYRVTEQARLIDSRQISADMQVRYLSESHLLDAEGLPIAPRYQR